ncbi:MAG: glycosyltransferase family 4 protein [bacterium]|nr:glycosyltransferase family 4 protein [bacterium]
MSSANKNMSVDLRMIDHSGIGTYLKGLISFLLNDSHTINLILNAGDHKNFNRLEHYNLKLLKCDSNIYSILEQIKLKQIIKNNKPALFWSPHYNIPIFCKCPLLVTIHDCAHLAMPEIYGKSLIKKAYVKFMFSRIKAKASHIITVSKFSKSEIIKYTGIEPERISVIYNGVDRDWGLLASGSGIVEDKNLTQVRSRQQEVRNSFNHSKFKTQNSTLLPNPQPPTTSHQPPYIIYVGNVKPHKNLLRLLQAFELIKDEVECNLVIVGKKDGFITVDRSVIKFAERLGARVKFTGYLSDEELKNFLVNAEIMVFPSLYEGFGLPPLEAMAAGVPTCVSDIPVLKEICGEAAEYFDPYDIEAIGASIKKLLKNELRKKELVRLGQERVKQFTWKKSAEKHLEVIKNLLHH